MYQLKLGEMSARDQRGLSMLGCTGNARLRGKLRGSRSFGDVKRDVRYTLRAPAIIIVITQLSELSPENRARRGRALETFRDGNAIRIQDIVWSAGSILL
jgi:hypothetical protein